MNPKRIAAAALLCLVLLILSAQAPANRSADDSLKWHSIRQYANLRESVDRKIYIHFWADWCTFCLKMQKETFANPKVASLLTENFFLIKVNTDKEQRVADAFKVKGLPSNLFLSEDGSEIVRQEGYIPPKKFMRVLEAIVSEY